MRAARGHAAPHLSQRECDQLPVGASLWLAPPGRPRTKLRVVEHACGHAVGRDWRRWRHTLDDVRPGGQVVYHR